MELKDIIALILGTIGTVLGIANYVRSILDDRVCVRVTPHLAWQCGDAVLNASSGTRIRQIMKEFGLPNIGVEVLNLSKFPVIIEEVGLCERNTKPSRSPFLRATTINDESYPVKLNPHERINLYSQEDISSAYPFTSRTRGYAMTSCDHVAVGRSHALSEWIAIVDEMKLQAQEQG